VDEIAALTQPARIHWVDGSRAENEALLRQQVDEGKLIKLNPEWRPGSYLARSHPSDVARTEGRTFIASEREEDAGPTNNWASPAEMRATLTPLFEGSMRGRTMYVVPFSMGAVGGPLSHIGVQITDSAYAVTSIGIMTRVGTEVLEQIAAGKPWVKTVHTVGAPLEPGQADAAWPCNDEKYIVHTPTPSRCGRSGRATAATRSSRRSASPCASPRSSVVTRGGSPSTCCSSASSRPRAEVPPRRRVPSACGKTNLAMLRPRSRLARRDPRRRHRVAAPRRGRAPVGDQPRGRLLRRRARHRRVDQRHGRRDPLGQHDLHERRAPPDGDVWWEGLTDDVPAELTDWEGKPWTPASGRPAAHPNSRFTVSAAQCPQIAPDWDAPEGVPLDGILFGGRRATNVPLVVEATDWTHGVFLGSNISSERTAAAEGTVGELRRDPFAMLPFCGYNMADYFGHWLKVGQQLRFDRAPRIFQVNWFRKGEGGKFLWPGFGDNARVIDWIIRRIEGKVSAVDSPIGRLPRRAT
jgi:phosphoenolpyruvate carboxykinase (GTP)